MSFHRSQCPAISAYECVFASVYPAADSKLNGMVSYKLVAKELVRWGKGKITITQGCSLNPFYSRSVKEEGKKWGAVGNQWKPAGN